MHDLLFAVDYFILHLSTASHVTLLAVADHTVRSVKIMIHWRQSEVAPLISY